MMIVSCINSFSNGILFFIVAVLVTILFSVIPAMIEAFWYCGGQIYLCITFTILYGGAIYTSKFLFRN
jgi:hypothetical protein